jgi:hypothetical protein
MTGAGHSSHGAGTVCTNGKRADVMLLVGILCYERLTGSFHELSVYESTCHVSIVNKQP